MTVSTIPPVTPLLKFFDNNGAPLAYGKLFTYQTATSTKQATYTDSTGNTPNTNPVILNARGEASVWLDSSLVYKLVLANSTDTDPPANPIWTQDPIGAFTITQVSGSFSTVTASGAITGANVVVVGSTIPANGIYLPATNRLGFATSTKARGYIDSGGIWNIAAPDASGPALTIAALGTNNINTIQLPTAGSQINLARSSDAGLNGYVGSNSGTSSFSLTNTGGTGTELEATTGSINLKTSGSTRQTINSTGTVTINAPSVAANTLNVVGPAATNSTGLVLSGTSTGYNFVRINNTSGDVYVGPEQSTGGGLLSGTTNYAGCLFTVGATPLFLGSNSTARMSISTGGTVTVGPNTAVTAGGAVTTGVAFSSTANFGVFAGSGVPTLVAAKGSLYLRSDGSSTSTRMYVATDSAGTWTAVTTAT